MMISDSDLLFSATLYILFYCHCSNFKAQS